MELSKIPNISFVSPEKMDAMLLKSGIYHVYFYGPLEIISDAKTDDLIGEKDKISIGLVVTAGRLWMEDPTVTQG
jgi:hypothetical protein